MIELFTSNESSQIEIQTKHPKNVTYVSTIELSETDPT